MKIQSLIGVVLMVFSIPGLAAENSQAASHLKARIVEPADLLQWGVGMLVVLAMFFACVWAMRKLTALTPGPAAKMRVLGGISVGMRERIVLVEVGKKQLVVGVAPGRIETLLVLEGDDCLAQQQSRDSDGSSAFAQKLMQAMKGAGRSDA
ncbi:MAG: flagellar biosynthetic protein FliO [Methylicorpusculum sp.]|uniref:flagellar biosynthetic protein FliO n=2 Tax=Methylicorpusculum sp. TaxID=2713644 RepID=UPI0027156ED5|nr:flagellar biosynthetic protein FliO [Methylicorpusculum sp.]MDO8843564.1 flagellar biosynthetic protein FliO [Methylicorpusculum sp.]MDO8937834.1 flagellar biosynthetic protein FliO [Methylicorpusculum sp.]MDP2178109.1 flagellar biosynthetic protein FliO [Methylicorpusculum sp.]MDP2202579.1 flagellar biosynthetic protein FliO [Methylicorpusculum sp.]MDP3528997.1 flagellar biosynthetic protein FliO [Methylicorpusculum sp.]